MAHFIRVLEARRIKNRWKKYVKEKAIGLKADEDAFYSDGCRNICDERFRRWRLTEVIINIKIPNTVESIIWKSFLGFIGGMLLTYVFFFFFQIAVNFSLRTSTILCALTGIVLSLGLAFSSEIRCWILLLLPVFFSKQGRQALLTYALFLAFTGPGRNTMHNMGILSDSMTCGQEMVRKTLQQINDMVSAPARAVKEILQAMASGIEEAVEVVRNFVMKIKRVIVSTLHVIKNVSEWLRSIVNLCNKKIGTPFQRCMKAFDDAIADCKAKLGILDFLCHVVHIVKALCYTVKWLDFICLVTEFASDRIARAVRKKLREFNLDVKNLFYVSVEISHPYKLETTAVNTTKEVRRTILQKLSKKMEKLQTIFSFFGCVFSLFFLFLFLKVYYYRYKYLSSDRYDNVYISNYIVELDIKRAQMDRETVLPLEPRERRLYAKPTSIRLVKNEKVRIGESMFLLYLTSFKIITFLVVDYSLFWILITIYEAGRDGFQKVEEPIIVVDVQGQGVLADFYRKLGKAFRIPENPNLHLNPLRCLPDPAHPDTGRYFQIGFLVVLCWILTVTEAYGLRLRNVVMSHYYPDRARERAVWLYNHIIQSRASFVRYARRQLRRDFGGGIRSAERMTLTQRLFPDYPLLGAVFGRCGGNCLICKDHETKRMPLKTCRTPDCPGRYCLNCFVSLENICTICQHPIDYGDVSDVSEEISDGYRDSSEEDLYGRISRTFESDSECYDYQDEFLTFEEMEQRDRFRDLEANRFPDYAKLGDLYSDKAALQRQLKDAIQKRLQHIERETQKASLEKECKYQKVKTRLKDTVCKLKNKKLEQMRNKKLKLKAKFLEKICNLRRLRERKCIRSEQEGLLGECPKLSRSRVSFRLEEDDEEVAGRRCQPNYGRLKNELRAKIESLKRRKQLRGERSFVDSDSFA